MKKRIIQYIIFLFFINVVHYAYGIDIYSYMSMPEKPLFIARPDWVNEESHLRLGYEINEEYKKWLGNQKVTSFDGSSFGAELQINPVKHFAFGFNKKFLSHQSWVNKEDKDLALFDFRSNNRVNGAYLKIGSDKLKFMVGRTKTDDSL